MTAETKHLRDELNEIRKELDRLTDRGASLYQPLEFALFGAALGVSGSLLLATIYRALLSRLLYVQGEVFNVVFMGTILLILFILPIVCLALVFDHGRPKRSKHLSSWALTIVLAVWALNCFWMIVVKPDLLGDKKADAVMFVAIVLITYVAWIATHGAFRQLAKRPR